MRTLRTIIARADPDLREAKLLAWVNRADIYRVKGIGAQSAELLEKAGVGTLALLAKSKPAALHAAITEANAKARKKALKQVPSEKVITGWIAQAKELPKLVRA